MKNRRVSPNPLIGILANIETMDRDPFLGQERTCLNQSYIQSIIKAGGIPLILPVVQEKEIIHSYVSLIDGLVLSGGYDVHPHLYGEEPHPDLGAIHPERDAFEIEALKKTYEQKKPILGICRGLQVINVAFGGTLYQDLSHAGSSERIKHIQQTKHYTATHLVDLISDTQLRDIFGQETIGTNTFHHQSVKKMAPGFIVNAKSRDGIIEGIEKVDYPFFIGVQWHPERMVDHHLNMLNLFSAFIAKASAYQSGDLQCP